MFLIKNRLFHPRILIKQTTAHFRVFNVARKPDAADSFRDTYFEEILNSDRDYQLFTENHFKLNQGRNCYIIQPYIKWGPKKLTDISPTEQLSEAKSLVETLPYWSVEDTISVPLENIDKKTVFKSGSLDKLKQIIRRNNRINAVFINVGSLKRIQLSQLEKEFCVEILDRYKVVIQILKIHATSKHAKLQVAMAELYYLQKNALGGSNIVTNNPEKFKMMFQNREQKLKTGIKELRKERLLRRNKRLKNEFPVIAVVGYTNTGKTSIIKSLTGDDNMIARNQLFATLDVTMHAGILPSGLKVLYVDTVGFISHIPTNLIECFVATLEDALLADVILLVEDISNPTYEFKRKHVMKTLTDLQIKTDAEDILNKIIAVGNKCDLLEDNNKDFDVMKVSAATDFGLDALRFKLEAKILERTDRQNIIIRLPIGGDEIRWLYKNSAVISEIPDDSSSQLVKVNIIIAHSKLQQFKHHFLKK